jgi:hypothetical protein
MVSEVIDSENKATGFAGKQQIEELWQPFKNQRFLNLDLLTRCNFCNGVTFCVNTKFLQNLFKEKVDEEKG